MRVGSIVASNSPKFQKIAWCVKFNTIGAALWVMGCSAPLYFNKSWGHFHVMWLWAVAIHFPNSFSLISKFLHSQTKCIISWNYFFYSKSYNHFCKLKGIMQSYVFGNTQLSILYCTFVTISMYLYCTLVTALRLSRWGHGTPYTYYFF